MEHKRNYNISDRQEKLQLRKVAEKVFDLKFDKSIQSGSERNMSGMRSEHLLFSKRLDSRTFFIHDSNYGIGREGGIFQGPAKVCYKLCRNFLRALKISLSEIDKETIVKEQTQVARVDYKTKKIVKEKVQEGKHIARVSRKVNQVRVWSSGIVLCLTQKGSIGYLQLHWPELPTRVIEEAHHLKYKLKHGWKPPEQSGAEVESMEAGIVHSPAIGFLMDIYPAIRVIYSPKDKTYGQKPVYYYDRHGKPIPIPRIGDIPFEERIQRMQKNESNG
jgi:hypothetical protein